LQAVGAGEEDEAVQEAQPVRDVHAVGQCRCQKVLAQWVLIAQDCHTQLRVIEQDRLGPLASQEGLSADRRHPPAADNLCRTEHAIAFEPAEAETGEPPLT
jgi:hypothetical protein